MSGGAAGAPVRSPGSIEWAIPLADLRAQLAPGPGRLAAVLARIDRWGLTDSVRAELLRWAGHLALVRGYRAATTVAVYLERVGRWCEFATARGWDLGDVSGRQWETWQQHLAMAPTKHLAAATRLQYVRAVRAWYDWRARVGISANCAADLIAPKASRRRPRKYTKPQLQAMLAAVAGDDPQAARDRAMLLLLLSTGLRREECAALCLDQVEMRERTAVVRIMGKGAKEREVAIEGPVVEHLRNWLMIRDRIIAEARRPVSHARLWCSVARSTRGQPSAPSAIEYMVQRVATAAKLSEWGVHRFRVTFATMLYDDGEDIERIRRLMGHESIETTRRYLDVSERNRSTRLSAMRQHELLGTKPAGLPAWAKMVAAKKGINDAPL